MITQSSLQARQRHPYHHLVEPPLHLGGFPIGNEVDPQLLALAAAASGHSSASQIDPALFAIEQVVNDVNRGRIGITDLGLSIGAPSTREERNDEPEAVHGIPAPPALEISDDASHGHVDMPPEADSIHIQLDDDGIDPALREIVNSLTNAQQVRAWQSIADSSHIIPTCPQIAMSATESTASDCSRRCRPHWRTMRRRTGLEGMEQYSAEPSPTRQTTIS